MEILQQVIELETVADVWKSLNDTFNKVTMDRELTLNHQLELLRRDNCKSLDDYLMKYKAIYDELAGISKPLMEDRKSFWMFSWWMGNTFGCLMV